ncbi:MAG: hypothetical protein KY476_15325 [Planctomycetes bacterium]|nr:hypothetical protein [Planctomycetota bacterium]
MQDEQLLDVLREIRDELRMIRAESRELSEKNAQQYQEANLQAMADSRKWNVYWFLYGLALVATVLAVAIFRKALVG